MPLGHKSVRNMSEAELVERIKNDWNTAYAAKSDDHVRCQRLKHIYEALNPPEEQIDENTGLIEDDEGSTADVYLPIGAAVADAAIAKLFNFIFADEDYFRIMARDGEDNLFAERVTQHMKARHREMLLRYKIHSALQQAVCYDFCVTGMRWLLRPGYEQQRKKEITYKQYGNIRLPFQRVTMEEVWIPDAIDRPDMFVLDYFRSYPDPAAKGGFEDSEFFIDERDIMLEELVNQSKTKETPWGKYDAKAVIAILKAVKEESNQRPDTAAEIGEDEKIPSRRVKIYRYWTPDHVAEMCKDQIIWRRDLAGWPLQLWKLEEKPMRFPGMGILQRMERNCMDINATMNARRNFQNLVADPWVVMDQSLISQFEGTPRMYAGRVLASSGGNPKDKVFVYNPGVNMNQDVMGDIQMQIDINEKTSGVSQADQATFASGRRSATEAQKVSVGADMRTFKIARKLEEVALEPAYMEQFKLEQMNMTKSERFTYFGRYGEEMILIDPADYRWNRLPNFMALGSISMAKDTIENQQLLSVLQWLQTLPQVPTDWIEAANEMIRRFAPKVYGKIIKDPNQPEINVPADMENTLMAGGRKTVVSKLNNHTRHIAEHKAYQKSSDYELWPQAFKNRMELHIQEHEAFFQNVVKAGPRSQSTQDGADALRGIRPSSLGVGP